MRAAITGLVAALVTAALVGCGGGEPVQADVDRDAVASLDRAMWDQTEHATAECMARQGFKYARRAYPGGDHITFPQSPFKLTAEEASAHGFGYVDEALAAARSAAADDDVPDGEQVSAAEEGPAANALDRALFGDGTPGTGCAAQAEQDAGRQLEAEVTRVVGDTVRIGQLVQADPRYRALWESWSECMASRGIDAQDLDTLRSTLSDEALTLVKVIPPLEGDGSTDTAFTYAVDTERAADVRAAEVAAAVNAVECLTPLRSTYESILSDAKRTSR